jgi:hypothetical protein
VSWTTGVQFLVGPENFSLGPRILPPIHWVLGVLSLGVKQPGREANRTLSSSAKVKNVWSYTSALPYVFMVWCLVRYGMSVWCGTYFRTGKTLLCQLKFLYKKFFSVVLYE